MDDPPISPHRAAEASITLELDRREARPGDRIRLRVLVPPEGVEWRDAIYGLAATLEHKAADGRWQPTHHLRFSHLTGEADFLRYGDPRWGYRLVGLSGSAWRPVRVPDDAQPGEYRIVKNVGGGAYAVPLVIR